MDIQYQRQCTERRTRGVLRRYYYRVWTPALVNYLLFAAALTLSAFFRETERVEILYGIAIGLVVAAALSETRYSRKMLKILRTNNAFKVPSEFHLTDSWFEYKRGEDISRFGYESVSEFIHGKDEIILLRDNCYVGAIDVHDLPDNGAELIECLGRHGAKPFRFLSFKRWWKTGLLAVLLAVLVWKILS